MKSIILCADDYGLNASVSQGIIELLSLKRLSAVSCMTTAPRWPEEALSLQPFKGQVDLGLHVNLTEGEPLSSAYRERYGASFLSPKKLIVLAFLSKLDVAVFEAECEAQLARFRDVLGFSPAYLDGHQHVHQLPVVREALLRVYERSLKKEGCYFRCLTRIVKAPGFWAAFKQLIIKNCGAPGFRQLLRRAGLPHNGDFAGVYSFGPKVSYAALFPLFLEKIQDQGLIMCHPGLKEGPDPHDPIATSRFQEYTYLRSPLFLKDCEQAGVYLRRF